MYVCTYQQIWNIYWPNAKLLLGQMFKNNEGVNMHNYVQVKYVQYQSIAWKHFDS